MLKSRWARLEDEAGTRTARRRCRSPKAERAEPQTLGGNLWQQTYDYGTVTVNNGNLISTVLTRLSLGPITTRYRYDGVNRLTEVWENPTSPSLTACAAESSTWCQGFTYDSGGNLRVAPELGYSPPLGRPQSYTAATNRVSTSGWGYDGRGNVNQVPFVLATPDKYVYDAEDRLATHCPHTTEACVDQTAGPNRTIYRYDAEGRRVKKEGAGGTVTYVYDASGNLALEFGSPGFNGVRYLTGDHLGSTRVITSDSGPQPVEQRDYRPFGEEIEASLRVGVVGYGVDQTAAQKFTGKERDVETGLDYFGARYFSGGQGRFTSPDKPLADQKPRDAQSWNLYAYVRNNPLKYVDEKGRELKLAIYNSGLPANTAHASANSVVRTLRQAGVKNVTYELHSGRPSGWDTFRYQMGPTPHSVLLEFRPGKAGDPTIPRLESGHNWGGQAAVDTSAITSRTADPWRIAIGVGNLGVHEVGHEVTPFHPSGDPVMSLSATDPNSLNPSLAFGPDMQRALQQRYNRPGEVELTPPMPPPPPPPPPPPQPEKEEQRN